MIGRVAAVTGAQATVELDTRAGDATVGKFMGLMTPKSVLSRGSGKAYFRPTRSISADSPAWRSPSRNSVSYSRISSAENSPNASCNSARV
jgi:hypothetical protein